MTKVLNLPQLRIEELPLEVHGQSPLIVHHWSDRRQIKPATSLDEMFEAARLRDAAGNDCVFASYFQRAIVDAAEHFQKIPKTVVRGALSVVGTAARIGRHDIELLPLAFERIERREDRIQLSKMELVYARPEYHGWRCKLTLRVNRDVLTADDVVELVEMAGQRIGIGRRRPQENGDFGRFTVFG